MQKPHVQNDSKSLDRFSFSRLTKRQRCPYMEHLYYIRRIRKRVKSPQMRLGTLVHAGLEGAILTEDPTVIPFMIPEFINAKSEEWKKENADWLDDFPDLWDEHIDQVLKANKIALRVVRWLGIDRGDWTTVQSRDGRPMVEYQVEQEYQGIVYNGVVDWVAKYNGEAFPKATYVIDFKTRKTYQGAKTEDFNQQSAIYQFLLSRSLGLDIRATATVEIKPTVPMPPHVTKRGTLSRSPRCDWPTYREAIRSHGFNESDYADVEHKCPDFQRFVASYRTIEEAEAIFYNAVATAIKPQSKTRHLNKDCTWCSFNDFCKAELRGDDTNFLLNSTYIEKEKKNGD